MSGQFLIKHVLVARVAVNACRSFWCDCTKLERCGVVRLLEVSQCMAIATTSIVHLAAASEMTASHAQPKIRLQVALATACKILVSDPGRVRLVQVLNVRTRLQIEFPLRNRRLIVS